MRLNKTLAYGLACLHQLGLKSGSGRWMDAKEVARNEGLPVAYCNKVLKALCHIGMVESARGKGYRLAKPLDQINVWDVMEAFTFNGAPDLKSPESSRALYECLREQVNRWLVGLTLDDVVESARQAGKIRN